MASNNNSPPLLTHLATSLIAPLPSSPPHPPSHPLSFYDLRIHHLQWQYTQWILLYHNQHTSFSSLVHKLKSSLSRTLVCFYPLAGRLHFPPEGGIHVLCNDAGVEFIEASANVTLSEMVDRRKPPMLFQLVPRNGAFRNEGFSLPLLSIQVTKLEGDGLAIGFASNHVVLDGYSAWHFKNSWAELCKGKESISIMPVFDPSAIAYGSTDGLPIMTGKETVRAVVQPSSLDDRVFHFSEEVMGELKKQANENRVEGLKPISSYQALSAYLWKCITKARGPDPEGISRHRVPVDLRRRLVPPAPEGYFGNAIIPLYSRAKVEELLDEGNHPDVANLLHKDIEAYNGEAIVCAIKEMKRSLASNTGTVWLGGSNSSSDVYVAASLRFPVYECDFGWGKPVAVRSGLAQQCDGKMTMCPGREGGGSADVEIILQSEVLDKLELLIDPATGKSLRN